MTDVFSIREARNALIKDHGEVEGSRRFISFFSNLIEKDELNLLRNDKISLKSLAEAIGFEDFSELIGNQSAYEVVRAYDAQEMPLAVLFDKMRSTQQAQQYTTLSATQLPTKLDPGKAPDQIYRTTSNGTITNYKWGYMVSILEEMVWFDNQGDILKRCMDVGEGMAIMKEQLRAAALVDTGSNAYLGGALYSAGSYTNHQTGAGSAISVANIQAMREDMIQQTQPGNTKIRARMRPQYFVVPETLENQAREILVSEKVPYSTENQINVVKDYGLQLVMSEDLSIVDSSKGTTAYYLVAPKMKNGLVEQYVQDVFVNRIVGTRELKQRGAYAEIDVTYMGAFGAYDFRGVQKADGA